MIVENNREAETSSRVLELQRRVLRRVLRICIPYNKNKSLLLRASSCILLPQRSVEATQLGSMLPLLQFPLSRYAVVLPVRSWFSRSRKRSPHNRPPYGKIFPDNFSHSSYFIFFICTNQDCPTSIFETRKLQSLLWIRKDFLKEFSWR